MLRSNANLGRLSASSSGSVPDAANCSTTPSSVYGLGGQPGRLMMVLSGIRSATPTAPVGSGSAEGMLPQEAQDPMAMIAAAFPATSSRTWKAGRPASFMYTPLSRVGIDPSTTQTYLPEYLATASFSASSAWCPAAAMSVSWYSSEMIFRIKSPRSG